MARGQLSLWPITIIQALYLLTKIWGYEHWIQFTIFYKSQKKWMNFSQFNQYVNKNHNIKSNYMGFISTRFNVSVKGLGLIIAPLEIQFVNLHAAGSLMKLKDIWNKPTDTKQTLWQNYDLFVPWGEKCFCKTSWHNRIHWGKDHVLDFVLSDVYDTQFPNKSLFLTFVTQRGLGLW